MKMNDFVRKTGLSAFVRLSGSVSLFLAGLMVSPTCLAHLMPDQHGTVKVLDNSVHAVLSISVNAFKNVDVDGDGKLSLNEYMSKKSEIKRQAKAGIQLSSPLAAIDSDSLKLMYMPDHHDETQASFIAVLTSVKFKQLPSQLGLSNQLWDNSGNGFLRLQANVQGQYSYKTLTPLDQEFTFKL